MVPVVQRNEPSVLLTERTAGLNDHGGEISFAGGKIDAGDANPMTAAVREAEEEIGLARKFVEPIGYRWLNRPSHSVASRLMILRD